MTEKPTINDLDDVVKDAKEHQSNEERDPLRFVGLRENKYTEETVRTLKEKGYEDVAAGNPEAPINKGDPTIYEMKYTDLAAEVLKSKANMTHLFEVVAKLSESQKMINEQLRIVMAALSTIQAVQVSGDMDAEAKLQDMQRQIDALMFSLEDLASYNQVIETSVDAEGNQKSEVTEVRDERIGKEAIQNFQKHLETFKEADSVANLQQRQELEKNDAYRSLFEGLPVENTPKSNPEQPK